MALKFIGSGKKNYFLIIINDNNIIERNVYDEFAIFRLYTKAYVPQNISTYTKEPILYGEYALYLNTLYT